MAVCSSQQFIKPSSLSFHEQPELVRHQIAFTLLYISILPSSGSSYAIVYTSPYVLYHYLLSYFCGRMDDNNDYYRGLKNIFFVAYEDSVVRPPKANKQKINGVSSG